MSSRSTHGNVPLSILWFALLGGPAAWSAHLLGSYPLVPVACRMGTTAPLNILTLVTAAVAGAATVASGWAYRRARPAASAAGVAGSESRAGFMGACGLLLGLLFTFAIVMEGLPPLLQDPCVEGF